MKTLLALLLLSASCFAQSIHDLEKTKVRMRINLVRYTPEGSICDAAPLVKNKLGREEPDKRKAADPFAANVFSGSGATDTINVIDIASLHLKAGDVRDVSLYPISTTKYALSASNALLSSRGVFNIPITAAALNAMAFEGCVYEAKAEADGVHCKLAPMMIRHKKDGKAVLEESSQSEFQTVILGDIAAINAAPKHRGVPQVKLFPTAKDNVFALSAADALKTWQPGQ